jgi:serine/threonine protein kinase
MNERQARFYFCEILLALEYLHDNDILYRDLKPENVVLDENGHLKLTDFGLSKINFKTRDKAYSFCGSPEYMAPEILVSEQSKNKEQETPYHNKSLDFYHLGALLYELLCGLPPFFSEDRTQMYTNIMFSPIKLPSFLSDQC